MKLCWFPIENDHSPQLKAATLPKAMPPSLLHPRPKTRWAEDIMVLLQLRTRLKGYHSLELRIGSPEAIVENASRANSSLPDLTSFIPQQVLNLRWLLNKRRNDTNNTEMTWAEPTENTKIFEIKSKGLFPLGSHCVCCVQHCRVVYYQGTWFTLHSACTILWLCFPYIMQKFPTSLN